MIRLSWAQLVVTLVVSVVIVAGLTYAAVLRSIDSSNSYKKGYEQGAWHALLYYDTVGEWPNQKWRNEHLRDSLQTEEDILETLSG